jgi:hypothetical protein
MKALGKGSIASIIEAGLGIARALLLALLGLWAVAVAIYVVVIGLVAVGSLDPETVNSVGRDSNFSFSLGPESSRVRDVEWTDWHIMVPTLLTAGVGLGGSLIIVTRLRRMFDSFRSGEPFRRENANHLRVIWITMLVIELARYALMVAFGVLVSIFGGPNVDANITLTIDLSTWGSILVLIVLAEVFREGARLKEEQELTI